MDKVDLLTLSSSRCTCQAESDALQAEFMENPSQVVSAQDCIKSQDTVHNLLHHNNIQPEINSYVPNNHFNCNSVMFSDSIGRGIGKLICSNMSYSTQNNCMPGSSYKQVMAAVSKNIYNPSTTITIFVGNSSRVKKEDITECVTQLLALDCSKIILCAFPYFENLSNSKNNYIHMLNKHLHLLASHYCDKLICLDINNFVDKLRSTRDTVYLPIKFRTVIARLLSYFIHTDIGNMSKFSSVIDTATISSNTNGQVVTLNECSNDAILVYNNYMKEDPCVTMENCQVDYTSSRTILPGDGLGLSGLTPDSLSLN